MLTQQFSSILVNSDFLNIRLYASHASVSELLNILRVFTSISEINCFKRHTLIDQFPKISDLIGYTPLFVSERYCRDIAGKYM